MSEKQLEEIRKSVEWLSELDVNALKQDKKEYKFPDKIFQYFNNFKKFIEMFNCEQFEQLYWSFLSENQKANFNREILTFASLINQAKNFSINQIKNNTYNAVDNLVTNIEAKYHLLGPLLISVMLFYNQGNFIDSQKSFSQVVKDGKKALKEIENITNEVKDVAIKAGVAIHAKIFDVQAKKYLGAAIFWGILSIVLVVFILNQIQHFTRLIEDIVHSNGVISSQIYISITVERIVTVSIFFTMLWVTIFKGFVPNMHLSVLNRHRANSMKTSQIFTSSGSNEKVRDVVLIQATDAIFKSGETGYLSKSKNTSFPMGVGPINIIEHLKNSG